MENNRVQKTKKYIRELVIALKYLPNTKHSNDFTPFSKIVHFSYHKCLTNYYNEIMRQLGREFGIRNKHFMSKVSEFEKVVVENSGKGIFSVNNYSKINFDSFPEFRGSHFIRDPRDLIVSGYKYHLWCNEIWCKTADFDWKVITSNPFFKLYIEPNESLFPQNKSYQAYLSTLNQEKGILLEILWRLNFLHEMGRWNFQNPNIIEFKYEELVGNERDCFEKIFDHYQFHSDVHKRGLEIVDQYSLKNRRKGASSHVRKGTHGQWKNEFTDMNKEVFYELTGDLIFKLGYER